MADVEKQVGVKESSGHRTPESDSPVEQAVGEAIPYIDPELEKKVLRKFDIWLLPQMMILVMISFLDRSNIGKTISPAIQIVASSQHVQGMRASLASRKASVFTGPNSTTSAPSSMPPT